MGNIKNNILIYQFIDSEKVYNSSYIKALLDINCIICFDLEDSLGNVVEGFESVRENIFKDISFFIRSYSTKYFGIRLNLSDKNVLDQDFERFKRIIEDEHIQIFLPKISSLNDIGLVVEKVKYFQLNDFELIPIIETKLAMENLKQLLLSLSNYSNKFAFGHCDYNFDCNNFPFHHQDSEKYWEWIMTFVQRVPVNLTFINSPYLNLKDHNNFQDMLSNISHIFESFGQITLSIKQSINCYNFELKTVKLDFRNKKSDPKLEIYNYAKSIVENFELNKIPNKNFAIIKESNVLISPQEYFQAKKVIDNSDNAEY